MKGAVLKEDYNPTLAAVETVPQGKVDTSCDSFLSREVFDSAELLEPPHNEVIGENTASVLSLGAVRHEPGLIEGDHDVQSLAVHLCTQGSF